MLFAVLASLVTAFSMFYIVTVDTINLVGHLPEDIAPEFTGEARADLRSGPVTHVVEIIDGYLLATVMFFSLGLYQLFISKIDRASEAPKGSKVLFISNLEEFKAQLAIVVLMIHIVMFFEHVLHMTSETPLDLLEFSGGIALVGLALYLSHEADTKH